MKCGTAAAVPSLLRAVLSTGEPVASSLRQKAVEALCAIEGPEAVKALIQVLEPDPTGESIGWQCPAAKHLITESKDLEAKKAAVNWLERSDSAGLMNSEMMALLRQLQQKPRQ